MTSYFQAQASEILDAKEVRQRKEDEKALATGKELKKMKQQMGEVTEDTLSLQVFYEFSFSEIKEATFNFDLSLKIGQGGYGDVYKGLLRHTEVAIKVLHSNSRQGALEFQKEVTVLSKLRHPNLVTLIGACPESFILVYEYLPNGSLEHRLRCKDNSSPLSWQTRICIARELCSALMFLHSWNPNNIVHGDLKPANILLDSNFVSKLSDFGICRILNQNKYSSNDTTFCCVTNPKGTTAYMDPGIFATGEITKKSDVYSFGIILLELLTGRPALGITKEVKYALDERNFKNLLDPTAGDWPSMQALELALMAMRCCEMNRQIRPDLDSDVWSVLEWVRVSCEERGRIPNWEGIASNVINFEHLKQHFGSKREDAAKRLGISVSTLKRVCRHHGIFRWPSRTTKRVWRPPDPHGENNPSSTFEVPSTIGQTTVENEMGGQNPEPNDLKLDAVNNWLADLFPDPPLSQQPMSTRADPALIQQPMPTSSKPAPSQQPVPAIPDTMPTIHKMPDLARREDMRIVMLKITYRNKMLKFTFPLTSGISELKEEVEKRLKLNADSLDVMYRDEEGDDIYLGCDEDLRDYLQHFSNQAIRLFVVDNDADTMEFR